MELSGRKAFRRLVIAFAAVLGATLMLAAAATLAQSQSTPSIDIVFSPHRSVPQNTAITGTVTLRGLDPNEYSSLIFRLDATHLSRKSYVDADNYLGDDINTDLSIEVDNTTETFTISVFEECSLYIYAYYDLVLTLSKADPNAPGGAVELATLSTQFSMSRYLEAGVPTATPPSSDTVAWLDPDPTTLGMTVHGEWHRFHVRADVTKYHSDHLGILAFGSVDNLFTSFGEVTPGIAVAERCAEDANDTVVNWRRAIDQPVHLAVCKEGQATVEVNHEADTIPPLAEYNFTVGTETVIPPPPTSTPRPTTPPPSPTSTPRPAPPSSSGGGFGGFGPAPVAPSFRDGFRTTREVAENTPEAGPVGEPVAATHPDDLDIQYTLSGADATLFGIDAETGQILVGEGTYFDFDGERKTYTVNVTATDTSGLGALIIVIIRVTEFDLGRYDRNDNGKIERDEVLAAVSDYFKDLIEKDEVIRLIRLYFAG